MPYCIDVFITHPHASNYDPEYDFVVKALSSECRGYFFRHYSVPRDERFEEKGGALSLKINEQVRQCSVFIILGGMYINYRKGIQIEIDIAKKYKKPILLIEPRSQQRVRPRYC